MPGIKSEIADKVYFRMNNILLRVALSPFNKQTIMKLKRDLINMVMV